MAQGLRIVVGCDDAGTFRAVSAATTLNAAKAVTLTVAVR
jgi:hypothetical protein